MSVRIGEVTNQLNQARLELREAENAREAAKKQLESEKSQTNNLSTRSVLQESAIIVATPEIDARINAQKSNIDGLFYCLNEKRAVRWTALKLSYD